VVLADWRVVVCRGPEGVTAAGRLKVAFVLPSLHGGGAERAAVMLLNGLDPGVFDVTLFLFAREGAYLGELAAHVHLEVAKRRGRLARLSELRDWIRRRRIDVVVSFLSHFTVFAAVRSARVGTKFIISQQTPLSAFLHDADYHWRKPLHRMLFTAIARRIYPRADLIACTSEGVAEDLMTRYGVRRGQVAVVHNPVDIADVARRATELLPDELAPDGRPTIMTAGRLAEAKNLPLLIDALQILASRMSFRTWILGTGDLEEDVRRRLRSAGLEQHVTLLGFQNNPWKYMAAADVFVLTSKYEGFGNVLIEAMASGTPVVATASFGTREIIRHGETGLLVDRHEPDAVAQALHTLLQDEQLRRSLAERGRASARDFSVTAITAAFAAQLQRVAAA
jgi:glycosyltransferase involved in cell wall biosynthesis